MCRNFYKRWVSAYWKNYGRTKWLRSTIIWIIWTVNITIRNLKQNQSFEYWATKFSCYLVYPSFVRYKIQLSSLHITWLNTGHLVEHVHLLAYTTRYFCCPPPPLKSLKCKNKSEKPHLKCRELYLSCCVQYKGSKKYYWMLKSQNVW